MWFIYLFLYFNRGIVLKVETATEKLAVRVFLLMGVWGFCWARVTSLTLLQARQIPDFVLHCSLREIHFIFFSKKAITKARQGLNLAVMVSAELHTHTKTR